MNCPRTRTFDLTGIAAKADAEKTFEENRQMVNTKDEMPATLSELDPR